MIQRDPSGQITLAIETAICGGSISILLDDIEIRSVDGGVSRAEEVLLGIDRLLEDCEMMRGEVDVIAALARLPEVLRG
jgi:hypothetical protein